jgi:hypothetical protein
VLLCIAAGLSKDISHSGFFGEKMIYIDLELSMNLKLPAFEGRFFSIGKQWRVWNFLGFCKSSKSIGPGKALSKSF